MPSSICRISEASSMLDWGSGSDVLVQRVEQQEKAVESVVRWDWVGACTALQGGIDCSDEGGEGLVCGGLVEVSDVVGEQHLAYRYYVLAHACVLRFRFRKQTEPSFFQYDGFSIIHSQAPLRGSADGTSTSRTFIPTCFNRFSYVHHISVVCILFLNLVNLHLNF